MVRVGCAVLALLLLLCPLLLFGGCAEQEDTLCVSVLDVGQSDCILLRQGERTMLIDTGSATERDRLVGELAAHGVKHLDVLVITHPHEDHYGNARTVLEKYGADTLLLSDAEAQEAAFALVTKTAERSGTEIKTVGDGYEFSLGDASCEVLCASVEGENLNNTSLVLRICFGDTVLLFMGDAEKEAELSLIAANGPEILNCDFLKIGHHGSDTATGEELLSAATPTVAVISCGVQNEFGFPHAAVLQRLEEARVSVYRTDLCGTLEFVLDGNEIILME